AIGQLAQVDVQEVSTVRRHERGGDFRMGEGQLDLLGAAGADDDGPAGLVRPVQGICVRDVLEDERAADVELTLDRDLGHATPGGADPALSHSVTDPPGSTASICTPPGACFFSSSGVPARSGNVPQ